MSFIYPRTIAITRPTLANTAGSSGYMGETPAQETPIVTGLPASIQLAKERGKPDAGLPADGGRTLWKVLMPLSVNLAPGSVIRGDIVTDDTGQRYQVWAPYINSLGPNLLVERLET